MIVGSHPLQEQHRLFIDQRKIEQRKGEHGLSDLLCIRRPRHTGGQGPLEVLRLEVSLGIGKRFFGIAEHAHLSFREHAQEQEIDHDRRLLSAFRRAAVGPDDLLELTGLGDDSLVLTVKDQLLDEPPFHGQIGLGGRRDTPGCRTQDDDGGEEPGKRMSWRTRDHGGTLYGSVEGHGSVEG